MKKLKGMGRYLACVIVLFGIFCIYGLRLIDWQLVNGEEILEESTQSSTSIVKMEASRGEILDVNGAPLAVNKTGYSIIFDKAYMTEETQNQTILRLTALLEKQGEKWVDELPITVNAAGNYEFIEGMEEEADALKKNEIIRLNPYSTAEDCMKTMVELYDCDGYSAWDTRTIVAVRYQMTKSGFSISNPYTFARDVSADTVGIISENKHMLPGVAIQITTERTYPNGTIAPHIVGTIGAISQEEYDEFKQKGETYSLDNISGYAYTDRIGKNGIEAAFEDELRGENGKKVIETTRTGSVASSTITQAPVAGNTVYLTIDSRIQAVAQASLAKNVQAAQEYGESMVARTGKTGYGEDCTVGAAVVLNLKDFTVLAAANYPSYDLAKYNSDAEYYRSLINNPSRPLFNSAFSGVFMPGSCYKPMVACAALQEGIINENTHITCNHYYDRWYHGNATDYRPTCMGWHGSINLTTGLQKSCNIFFYETGVNLGIETMDLYAQRFGFGQRTGVEISEGTGLLASPEERVAAGGQWNPGDVAQAAIGQSDNAVTPIQLATYVATICNGGERLKTSVVSKITNYTRDKVIMEHENEVVANVGVSQENLDLVMQAMRTVCQTGGTAGSVFNSYDIAVAGKTGTAQVPPHSDNVVFVGFAPYEDPEIAIAVVLQYGATSKYSNAVAKDIFDAYFHGYTVDSEGNIVKPVEEDTAVQTVQGETEESSSENANENAATNVSSASESAD